MFGKRQVRTHRFYVMQQTDVNICNLIFDKEGTIAELDITNQLIFITTLFIFVCLVAAIIKIQ